MSKKNGLSQIERFKIKTLINCFVLKCWTDFIFSVQPSCVSDGYRDSAVEDSTKCHCWPNGVIKEATGARTARAG